MGIESEDFGTVDGPEITRYVLKNRNGVQIKILNLGGIITDILLPDKNGKFDDICLGYDDIEGYKTNPAYLGAIIGRCANRISSGKIKIKGTIYNLNANEGSNVLHGGIKGFNKRVWKANIKDDMLALRYISPDGEEGFPGEMTVDVKYHLTEDNELVIDYTATTDKPTVINLTNHAYFNLSGHNADSIANHMVQINTDSYTPQDDKFIPTGEISLVDNTLLDLRIPKKLGDVMPKLPEGLGFVHNYCFGKTGWIKNMARIDDPTSGRYIEVSSTEPGLQFYTSCFLNITGKGNTKYQPYGAFCLETQHYPDSPNKATFPTTILEPGETFRSTTTYKFGVTNK